MAEQGEATAIIRWEIFSNRPRMFKSIEKARKVFILLSFLSVFEQFHNFDNFRQGCKRGREFIFTLHIWLFYFFFLFWYISSYRQCTTTLSTYLFNQPVEMYQMANLQNRQANVSRLIACETELNILNYLNMQGIHITYYMLTLIHKVWILQRNGLDHVLNWQIVFGWISPIFFNSIWLRGP